MIPCALVAVFCSVLPWRALAAGGAVVQFKKAAISAGEMDYWGSLIPIEVVRRDGPKVEVVVHYTTVPLDAAPGRDYQETSGTLKVYYNKHDWIYVPVYYDWDADGPVRFNVVLSEPNEGTRIGRRSVTTVTITNTPWSPAAALKASRRIKIHGTESIYLEGFTPSSGSFIQEWSGTTFDPMNPLSVTCNFAVAEIRPGPIVCYGFSCFSTSYTAGVGNHHVTFTLATPYSGTFTAQTYSLDGLFHLFGPSGTFELIGPKPGSYSADP